MIETYGGSTMANLQQFGGDWTTEKLLRVQKYLVASRGDKKTTSPLQCQKEPALHVVLCLWQ
jgi:hypothetical protein